MKSLLKSLFIEDDKTSLIKTMLNLGLTLAIFGILTNAAFYAVGIPIDFGSLAKYTPRIVDGYILTFIFGILSFFVSLTFGIIAAILKNSKILILKNAANIYIEIIRGTPLLTQIMLFFYIIGTALNLNNRLATGVIILSIFEGAYIAEIIRGSLMSISAGQLESAKAVGFNRLQTLRYVLIPQLVARTLPALTGQFASIVKDSSLLSIISITEMTMSLKEIGAQTYDVISAYLLLGLLYLTITLPLSFASKALEKRFVYES